MTFVAYIFYTVTMIIITYLILVYSGLKRYFEIVLVISKMDGPPALPILGNIMQVIGTPVQIFKNMRHVIKMYQPTFRAWIGTYPSVNTICPDVVEKLVAKHQTKKGIVYELFRCWLGTGLLTSDGDKWSQRRKTLTPSFHFSILLQFVDIFNKHAKQLVENLKKKEENGIDVTSVISEYTLHTVCEAAMGTCLEDDPESQKAYKYHVERFGEILVSRIANPLYYPDLFFWFTNKYAENKATCETLHKFTANIIQKRSEEYLKKRTEKEANVIEGERIEDKSSKRKMAMLDVLLSAKYVDKSIDDEGIREEVDTFVLEGHDTTLISLCYTLMLLACNKHCQNKIYEEIEEILGDGDNMPTYNDLCEMKYMERCIKESLRLYPSVPIISRLSDGKITIDGHTIPENGMINIFIYDMHRNPKVFPDPDKFDPDRFLPENVATRHPFAYIPFSAGQRNCIGQRFAMLEMKACLTAILKNFILEPIDTPETIEMITDLVLRPNGEIKVKFLQRQ